MKDEYGGNQILRFVGLRSKLYAYEIDRESDNNGKCKYNVQKKKCKGVRKYIIKKDITIGDYEECLFSKQPQFRTMSTIRSRQHDVGAERVNKTAPFASPTFILSSTTKQDIVVVLSFSIDTENLDDKPIEVRSLVITVLSGFTNLALTSNVRPFTSAMVTSSNDNVFISIFVFSAILSFLTEYGKFAYPCGHT